MNPNSRREFLKSGAAASSIAAVSGCTEFTYMKQFAKAKLSGSDIVDSDIQSTRLRTYIENNDPDVTGEIKLSIHEPLLLSTISPVTSEPDSDADPEELYDPLDLGDDKWVVLYDEISVGSSRVDVLPPIEAWRLDYWSEDEAMTAKPLQMDYDDDVLVYMYRQEEGYPVGAPAYSESPDMNIDNGLAFVVDNSVVGGQLVYDTLEIESSEYEWKHENRFEFAQQFVEE